MVLARVRVVRGLPPARLPAQAWVVRGLPPARLPARELGLLPAQLPAQLPARELGLLPARQLAHPLVQAPVPNLDRSNSSTAKLSGC
jgi:hypothetical protein